MKVPSASRTRGNSLVGMLVVVAIILVLVVVMFKGSGAFSSGAAVPSRKDGHGTTTLGAAEYAAKDDVCRSNLGQVRAALQIASAANDDKFPEDLKETKLPAEFYACAVKPHEPYQYDATTGTVHCTHPGHEKY